MRSVLLAIALWATSGCTLGLSDIRCDHLTRPVADGPETRVIQTRVVEHSAWSMSPGRDATALVAEVSELWGEQFGIRFEIVSHESVTAAPMLETLSAWRREVEERRFHGDEELILIFSRSTGLIPETAGILVGMVIVAPGPLDSGYHLLNHGLGHVFGLGHDLRVGSFMDVNPISQVPGISSVVPRGFTEDSKKAIRDNKWCSFRPEWPFYARVPGHTAPEARIAMRIVQEPAEGERRPPARPES